MSVGSEPEELRTLQQKAYGREGVLTAPEWQRLRELEDARRSASTAGQADAEREDRVQAASPPDQVIAGGGDGRDPGTETAAVPEGSTPSQESALPEPFARALQRHAAALLVALAVVLAIGVGTGWALFSPREASIPLTDEQQQRRSELASAPFDPSSVRAIAQKDEALAWYATQEGGASICLILDVGAQSQTDCLPSDQIGQGLSTSLAVPADSADGEGADSEVVYATLVLSSAGEPLVGMQRWNAASSALGWFDGAERDRAESLIDEGYELGLSSLGRFRGAPVWVADRLTEQGSTERCLIVDAASSVSCTALDMALREGIGAQIIDTDPAGTVTAIVLLEMNYTDQQTPYLSVTEAPVTEVAPGETVRVDAPPGDPILVEPPGRGAEN